MAGGVVTITTANVDDYRTLYARAPFDARMVAQPGQRWGAAPGLETFDQYASGVVTFSRSEPPTVEDGEPMLVVDESPVQLVVWTAPGPAMWAAMFCRIVNPQSVKITALAAVPGRYGPALDEFAGWLADMGYLSARFVARNLSVVDQFAGRRVVQDGPNLMWQVA